MTHTPRRLSNHFHGDVTVDVVDGINADVRSYQATWDLPSVHADFLVQFFRDHACKAFLWAVPGDSYELIWKATNWTRSYVEADRDTVQATFEQRFMAQTPAPALPPPPAVVFRLDSSLLSGPILLS